VNNTADAGKNFRSTSRAETNSPDAGRLFATNRPGWFKSSFEKSSLPGLILPWGREGCLVKCPQRLANDH